MDRYPRRLIEVDLPIKRISAHARREKSIRHGHISTLHIWWARRPLAACRAVICAALWPDPADELCPAAFREATFRIMSGFAREAMNNRTVRDKLLSEITLGKVMTINQANGMFDPENANANSALRYFLLDFIADFANWDASTNPLFLETARALTQAGHHAMNQLQMDTPIIEDPFAGGGAIPFEGLKLGAHAVALDLNPVAALMNKVLLEYIPKYGARLADDLEKWVDSIYLDLQKQLEGIYPLGSDGAQPLAYLWSRTIRCEGPNCGAEIPLQQDMCILRTKSRTGISHINSKCKNPHTSLLLVPMI